MADISTETKDDTNAPAPGDGDGAAPPPAPDGPATPPRDEPAPAEEAKPEGAPPRPEPQPNGAEAQTNGAEAGPDEAGEEEINIGLPQVKGAISLPPDRPLANAEPILLNDRFDIHPAKPLHDLDPPSARAFEAADRLEPTRAIFALVCIPGMPIRTDVIKQIVGEEIPGTLDLLDEGAVDWPLLGQRCQILVLQRPLGGRAGVITTMELSSHRKADIIRLIVEGVAGGLQQLSFRSIAHGAIRHDNVFFLDADRQSVVLGEFVSVPSGFDQPTVFETIERGMANRAGRGEASKMDDFYSLGVMLVFLILGRNPTGNLDDHQLIATKIAQTSFMALAGKTQISVTYLDALRGLLNDDQEERWDFEELEHWISGQRLSTLSSKAISKAPRPLKFGGEEHYFSRTLAHAMNMKPDGALKLIRDHTLDQWLERGLEEKEMAHAVEQSIVEIDAFQSDKTIANDILLARVLMLMDPGAPIRYKSLSFFPKGLGPWLAVELLRKGDTKIFVEAINRNIADNWFTLQNQGLP
ncbi:MAG: hypothetical protein QGF09_10450, partial [Rhodospirillales bacterium]|nr:hypothetical protein [Rhodospirillales bacterium]